jgi:hypothetical protein
MAVKWIRREFPSKDRAGNPMRASGAKLGF